MGGRPLPAHPPGTFALSPGEGADSKRGGQDSKGGSEKREWSTPVCQALCWASVTGCRGAWGPGISPAWPLTLMAL